MTAEKEMNKTERPKKKKVVTSANVPGKDISTAGFAVAVASIFTNLFTFGLTALVGLTLSIIGRIQTSKAGYPNSLALAGIIISGIVMALTFIAFVFFLMLIVMSPPSHKDASDIMCEEGVSSFWQDCEEDQGKPMPYPHNQG